MAVKGKEVAGKSSAGRRKAVSEPSAAAETSKSTVLKRKAVSKPYAAAAAAAAEKSGTRKKRMRSVANFFDDEAVDADSGQAESDNEDEDDQDFLDDIESEGKGKNESGMRYVPFLVKEEELSDEELENLLKQRYRHGSEHVVCADESKETTEYDDREALMASMKDPTLWRVKCAVGREQYLAFCLIQKYFDVQSLGTKLPMISVLALDHMKGYIYVEADRQFDVSEACKGVCNIYPSKISPVLNSEVPHLLSVRDKVSEVSAGAWVRVKYGTYKGDLAQVVAVDKTKRHAMIKLVPRIDLQALSQKLGNGVPLKQAVAPAPRLISSRDLEMFGDHIQRKQDRLTGEFFETIDGLMLKNGYLHKKLAFGSLTCWEVQPLPEEKEKFKVVDDLSENSDWLSGIYRGRRKTHPGSAGKGMGETSEGISETDGDSFELHDLVLFGGTDFGVIVGMESHTFQILRGDPERADTVAVNIWEVKSRHIDKAISAPDIHKNIITVDDSVKVSEGPYKGHEGIVKHIYGDTIFIHDSNHLENDGFLCAKSEFCEAIKYSADSYHEMDAPPGFDNPIESPVIPQSPQRPDKWGENERPFNRDRRDGDCTFSIGQTLRIRVGPLKGHLCRVVAMYRSDVTVKLDSQPKVIKVNSEFLSEAGTRNNSISTKESWQNSSARDFLGSSTDINPFGTISSNNNNRTGGTADPWESSVFGSGNQMSSIKATSSWDKAAPSSGDQNASWNKSTEVEKAVVSKDQSGGWDAHAWGKSTATNDDGSGWTGGCQKKVSGGDQAGSLNDTGGWGKAKFGTEPKTKDGSSWTDSWEKKVSSSDQAGTSNDAGSWGKAKHEAECQTGTANIGGWEKAGAANEQGDCRKTSDNSWDKGKEIVQDCNSAWNSGKGNDANETNSWGKAFQCQTNVETGEKKEDDPWGRSGSGWKGAEGSSGNQQGSWNNSTSGGGNQGGGWNKVSELRHGEQASGWNNSNSDSGGQSGKWGNFKASEEGDAGGWNKSGQTDRWNRSKPYDSNWKSDWDGDGRKDQAGGWSKQKDFDGGQGSDWNSRKSGNYEGNGGGDQEDGWNKQSTFGSGRGFGGRRGRGGNRGRGGRDYSDREKTYGGDQGFSRSGDRDERSNEAHGWNKQKDSDGGWGSDWNGGRTDFGGGNENDGDGWNKGRTSDGGRGFGGRRGRGGRGRGGSDFSGREKPFGGDQGSSWNRDGGRRDQTQDWNKPKSFDGGSGSGWGGSAGQEDGWNTPKSFDGDRGFGGRRGRGRGNRGRGGREYSDGEKSYDRDQSFSWNTDPENSWKGESGSGGAFSGWNNKNQDASGSEYQNGGQRASDENNKSGWNKGMRSRGKEESGSGGQSLSSGWKASDGDHSAGWSKGWSASKEEGESGTKSSGWKTLDGSDGSGWNKGWSMGKQVGGSEGQSSGWKTSDGDRSAGWSKGWSGGKEEGGNGTKSSSWKTSDGGNGSGRNKGWSTGKEVGGSGGHSSGLKASDGDHSAGWSKGWSGGKEEGGSGTKSSDWKTSDMGNGSGWNKGWSTGKEAGGGEGQSSGWGKDNRQGSGWNEGQTSSIKAAGEMGNEADGLNSKKGFDGTPSAGWNTGADTNKDTGVDGGGGWNRGNARDGAGSWDKHDGGSGSSKGGW